MKLIYSLLVSLILFILPATAEGRHEGHEGRSEGRHVQQNHHERPVQRGQVVRGEQRPVGGPRERGGFRGEFHPAPQHREFRQHWDGRRFDSPFFETHWGYRHRWYWNRCEWYGPRYAVGSYFWWDGVYFVIVQPVPVYWYDDPVTVIYVDDGYYIVDPVRPGVRIAVNIRF